MVCQTDIGSQRTDSSRTTPTITPRNMKFSVSAALLWAAVASAAAIPTGEYMT
jgi:hypothetical protein